MPGEQRVDGRRERSRLTRARIVDAAAALYVERGYVATTIEDVAARADVAVQTVYYVFGTKPALLAAVLDASIGGDTEAVAVLDRDWVDAFRTETDPAAAVSRLLEATVEILVRAAPIYEVVRRAAADPNVLSLLESTRQRRRDDQRQLIQILSTSGHLRPDVDVDMAADVLYGLMNEEVFQLLVGDCGWDVDQFRAWATELMRRELIED